MRAPGKPRPILSDELPLTATAGSLLQRTFSGHSERVVKVLAADSNTVISSSQDLTVIVWNAQSGERRHVLTGHGGASRDFAQHGNLLFAGGDNGTVQVWNMDDGHRVHVLESYENKPIGRLALNQDASLLATAISGGGMDIWDVARG
jgi:WD40 repeat protein